MGSGFKIVPLGLDAVSVEFGDAISIDLNERVIAFADAISADPFPGFVEAFPAYSSVTVVFDPRVVRRTSTTTETVVDSVSKALSERVDAAASRSSYERRILEIQVDFSPSAGPDLPECAKRSGLSIADFIRIFTAREYRVFMLGFLPGFPYMGIVDKELEQPRRPDPRSRIEKGSVGIAGRQTGIYPLASPGGWQIVGRTYVEMFLPRSDRPALLAPGDRVRFIQS